MVNFLTDFATAITLLSAVSLKTDETSQSFPLFQEVCGKSKDYLASAQPTSL